MKGKNNTRPLLAIIAVNFIWGFDFIAIEYMMNYLPAQIFTLARLLIGALVLVAVSLIVKKGIYIRKEDFKRFIIAGGVGMSLYFTVENIGTGMTSASFSSFIMATVPVFGMVGDRIFFGRRITALKIVCVAASIAGVYMLVAGDMAGSSLAGLAVMLAAAVLWAFFIIYVKPLYDKYDMLTIMTGLFLAGTIVQIPLTLLTVRDYSDLNFTATGIIITVATALICIIAGEFGYVYAIGRLSVTLVSVFENVLPLTTVIFSFFIFGSMLTPLQIAGGIIIMAAVTLLALKGEKDEDEQQGR